ncbi:MAG: hypothetical protein QW165_05155 [Candidatus Woesearchaeota archaeon]
MQTFTSPFLPKILTDRGRLLRHLEKAELAISFHLQKIVPKGSIICAYHPKSILAKILPNIAKEKNCKIIAIHGTKEAMQAFIKSGTLTYELPHKADTFLAEPDGLTADGALFNPKEVCELPHNEIIAVGSVLQFTNKRPANYDVANVSKIVTEIGTYTPEHLALEIPNAFFWPSSHS